MPIFHTRTVLSAAFALASLASATAHPFFPRVVAASNTTASPPTLDHLFTIQLILASALKPITIPSVEPIVNGTVIGPRLNATITGGVAYPSLIYSQIFQIPEINVWGTTDDGQPFFVKQTGVGLPAQQISRIEIEVGGNYTRFATSFIIGVLTPFSDTDTSVTRDG